MTERVRPAQRLEAARQALVAQLDAAWQQQANLKEQVATRQRDIAAWDTRIEALTSMLNLLGPAPTRGRPRHAMDAISRSAIVFAEQAEAENPMVPIKAGSRA